MFSQICTNKLKLGLSTEGSLLISGRSVDVNNQCHFDELITKCRKLKLPLLSGTINLEYINSASLRKIVELFGVIEKNDSILNAVISFFVDNEDEDLQEMWAMAIAERGKINYSFYECGTGRGN